MFPRPSGLNQPTELAGTIPLVFSIDFVVRPICALRAKVPTVPYSCCSWEGTVVAVAGIGIGPFIFRVMTDRSGAGEGSRPARHRRHYQLQGGSGAR